VLKCEVNTLVSIALIETRGGYGFKRSRRARKASFKKETSLPRRCRAIVSSPGRWASGRQGHPTCMQLQQGCPTQNSLNRARKTSPARQPLQLMAAHAAKSVYHQNQGPEQLPHPTSEVDPTVDPCIDRAAHPIARLPCQAPRSDANNACLVAL
jgi:hypothetical protein